MRGPVTRTGQRAVGRAADNLTMDAPDTPRSATPAPAPAPVVMTMLQGHVPISLLADLTLPGGPDSQEILVAEGKPEVAWWARGPE